MNEELRKYLSVDLGYPGIEIGCEQSAIDVFVENIPEYVKFASSQYALRARRAVDAEYDLYDPGEYHQEIQLIEDRANKDLPQFYYRQAGVMLWAHFEWSIKRLINYSRSKDKELPPLGSKEHRLNADTFCKQVKKFFKKEFGEKEILDGEHWEFLGRFNIIRSSIAHSNGALEGLDNGKREKVIWAVTKIDGLEIVRDYLMLSQGCVDHWHEITSKGIKSFMNIYAKKYPGAEAFGGNEI